SVAVEELHAQLALGRVEVHEQMPAAESDRPRRQRARRRRRRHALHSWRRSVVHRGEPVAPQGGEARTAHARRARPRPPLATAHEEVESIADYQAAAACRLDVRPVPRTDRLRHVEKRAAVGTMPVEAVAAEADADVVRLLAHVALAAKDREEAE